MELFEKKLLGLYKSIDGSGPEGKRDEVLTQMEILNYERQRM